MTAKRRKHQKKNNLQLTWKAPSGENLQLSGGHQIVSHLRVSKLFLSVAFADNKLQVISVIVSAKIVKYFLHSLVPDSPTSQTFSFSLFSFMINWFSLGFGLLVGQNTLNSGKLGWIFVHYFWTFHWLKHESIHQLIVSILVRTQSLTTGILKPLKHWMGCTWWTNQTGWNWSEMKNRVKWFCLVVTMFLSHF